MDEPRGEFYDESMTPADVAEEAGEDAELASEFGGDDPTPVTDSAQSLRSNATVQKVVNDIRSAHSADEIAELMTKNPTEVPFEFLEESAIDYAVVEGGDTNIGSPADVASAVWLELHQS